MTWRLIVEAQAEAEIRQAAAWYGQHDVAVRGRFLTSVGKALDRIKANPLQYQVIRGRVRRVRIVGFAYSFLYSISDSDVIVAVCIHTSRDPTRWHARFPE